jgi:hypothetical protein
MQSVCASQLTSFRQKKVTSHSVYFADSCFGGLSATFSVTSVSFLDPMLVASAPHCEFSLHFCLLLHNFCHLLHLLFFFLQLHVQYEISILVNWFEVLVYSSFLKIMMENRSVNYQKWMCITQEALVLLSSI